jgi:SagB-type dehydrogenase family enzyme
LIEHGKYNFNLRHRLKIYLTFFRHYYVKIAVEENNVKVRLLCICALFVLPVLLAAGCEDDIANVEQRPIIIPSEENGFQPGQPPMEQGLPPPMREEPREQSSTPSQSPESTGKSTDFAADTAEPVTLPEPQFKSAVSLEEALLNRRSIRHYTDSPLTINDVSQLLWAAQGITDDEGRRTAPSAMATYPLHLFLVAGDVTSLAPGSYLYRPAGHEMVQVVPGDMREEIGMISYSIEKSPVYIIVTADMEKMTDKAGNGTERFVYLEAGHAAQNICLQATALGLGTVTVAGFQAEQVKSIAGIPKNLEIIYVMPVGHIE